MSRSYYDILGVPATATAPEIKKAYHKQALKFHPDRNHGGDPEKFQEINTAYHTLSDASKRRVYDQGGADAVRMYENYYEEGGEGAIAVYACLAYLLLLLLFLVPLFIALKVDGNVAWTWRTTFVPVWIMDCLVGLAVLVLLLSIRERRHLVLFLVILAQLGVMVAVQVFIARKLDGMHADMSWTEILLPLIVFDAVRLISALFVEALPGRFDEQLRLGRVYAMGYFGFLLLKMLTRAGNLLTLILFALRLDDPAGETQGFAWVLVFLPALLAAFVSNVVGLQSEKKTIDRVEFTAPAGADDPAIAEQRQRLQGQWVAFVISILIILATFILLIMRLDLGYPLKANVILIPIYIMFGLVLGCIPLCMLCVKPADGAPQAAAAPDMGDVEAGIPHDAADAGYPGAATSAARGGYNPYARDGDDEAPAAADSDQAIILAPPPPPAASAYAGSDDESVTEDRPLLRSP